MRRPVTFLGLATISFSAFGPMCYLSFALKGGHLKLKLLSVRFPAALEGIFFNQDRVIDRRNVRFAFKLDVNRYRGVDRVQLLIVHYWP